MSTFEETRSLDPQIHFTVIEIDLPVVEGECTISGEPGYGTPLSCDQPSDAIKTYKFTQTDAPLMPESGILRVVDRISENPAKLQSGRGLASRGTGSVTFINPKGDPNPFAPAVTEQVKSQGTFFGKLKSRNILENKDCRIKNYRVEADGTIDLANGAQTRYYIIESLDYNKNGMWSLKLKDELSKIDIDESVWPLPLEGSIRTDVNPTASTINVDANVAYAVDDTVRVGEEFMRIESVSNIGTGSASFSVGIGNRGNNIVYTSFLTATVAESHDAGDEIFVCEISDDERLDDLLERILLDVGIDASFIPKADWIAEIDEWHPTTRVNTLWFESLDTSAVLESILTFYMIDMWFDPVAREIKISAISAWQESASQISEENEIDFQTVNKSRDESLRVTRALVIYNKRFLATSDSVENYKQASLFKRSELEDPDLFGEPKTKRFDYSSIIDKDSADLLVNRTVNRYIDPYNYSWITQERKLTFNTGDVVDTTTYADVGFDGNPSSSSRVQITQVKPMYKKEGRSYAVSALSYEPLLSTGSEIVITGSTLDINLFIQYAGAPSEAVELTFIFDATLTGSTSGSLAAIRAGAFPVGSKIIIIMVNGADLQAAGGFGGRGGSDPLFGQQSPGNGNVGGVVYDAMGVDTDIYFSGVTPSGNYPIADGYLRAPSGGDGGFDAVLVAPNSYVAGNGGNGGSGRNVGVGGVGGLDAGNGGDNGNNGNSTSGFGLDGVDNDAAGGSKGNGVIDNGATVTFFGSSALRYVNGGGDH